MEPIGLEKTYRTTTIIGGGIITSTLFLAILVQLVKSQNKTFQGVASPAAAELLQYILYGLTVLQIVVIRIVRGAILKKAATDDSKTSLRKLNASAFATYALCEVPAIYGLILFLVGGLYKIFYLFLIYSLVLQLVYFPRYNNWRERIASSPDM